MKTGETRPTAPHPKPRTVAPASAAKMIQVAAAPLIYWDVPPPAFGYADGVGHVALEAFVHAMPDMRAMVSIAPVCHLRMPIPAVRELRKILQVIELLATQTSTAAN